MSPGKLVDENDRSTWVAMTKVAPVKFTKWFLFFIERELQWCYYSRSQTAPCPLSSFDTPSGWQPVTLDLDDLTGK